MAQKDKEKNQKTEKTDSSPAKRVKKSTTPKPKSKAAKTKKKDTAPAKSKAAAKKSAPAKKKATPKKADKPKSAKKPTPKKTAKPASTDNLLFRRFDTWKPEKLFTPEKVTRQIPSPPPLVETADPETAAKIRSLLFKRFDLSTPPAEKVETTTDKIPALSSTPPVKPSPPPPKTPVPPTPVTEEDPADKMIKLGVLVLAVLFLIVAGASRLNMQKYYLTETDGALEIWKGSFSPSGTEQLIILPGVTMPAETKAVYKKEDVYPLIYQFYLDKADALLSVPGIPDFEGVKGYLNQAIEYTTAASPPNGARERLNQINAMILTLKSDAAAARNTPESLEEARSLLQKAARMDLDPATGDVIADKLAVVETAIESLKNGEKEPAAPTDALEAE